ncbi:MAG: hypothetical protein IJG50_04445 [Clostridia bacterium]|nr:hypothetical protein [Clostridia bacterium]
MKNSKIIASWDKIEPSDSANERMLSAILEENRRVHKRKDKAIFVSRTEKAKKLCFSAVVCLAALIAIIGIAGINLNWFGTKDIVGSDAGTGVDGTVMPGGSVPEGIDPVVSSVAVYPADKSLADIADASLKELTEDEAYSFEKLSTHLPSAAVDGYRFGNASLYETTMKDGSKYYMLRVDFTTGDGNTADYSVQVTNFEPQTEDAILTSDNIPSNISETGYFHFVMSGIYFGMNPGDLTYEEIMLVVNSID